MTTGRSFTERYRLGPPLGAGAYGVVYAATRLADGAEVAIKTLRREMTRDAEVVRRFEQEARLASHIRHPALVEVLEAGLDPREASPYIVQPLLRGMDLRAALEREGRLAPRAAVDLMVPVMAALLALHREGIVHRDVTPSNIFLVQRSDGGVAPTLIDFGVAKFLNAGSGTPRTVTGQWLGTPAYMAPEQVTAARDVDRRCDVWSVGVVLFELITGNNPFRGSSVVETLQRVRERRAPPLCDMAEVSPDLAAAIDRALAPGRDDRWPEMGAFLQALFDCPAIDGVVTGVRLQGRHRASLDVRHVRDDGTSSVTPLVPFKPFDEGPDTTPWLSASRPPPFDEEPDTTPWLPASLVAAVVEERRDRLAAVQLVEGWRPDQRRDDLPPGPRSEDRPEPPPELRGGATPPRKPRRVWPWLAAGAMVATVSALAVWLRGGADTYAVNLSVAPREATIEWNDRPAGTGAFARELPRDGRTHTLQIRAPGHEPHIVVFRDSPPPPTITLRPE